MPEPSYDQYFIDTSNDLLYGILKAAGGSDVLQYFDNTRDDLLYAILTQLRNGGGGGSSKVTLAPGTSSYNIPAGAILKDIWFQGGSAANIGVGLSDATNELFDPGELPEGGDLLFDTAKPFRNDTTIYFNGVQEDTITIIYFL